MQEIIIAASVFLLTVVLIAFYRKENLKRKFVLGIDINKKDQRKLPEGTGIVLLPALWLASAYFAIWFANANFVAWAVLISAFAAIGFLDDTKHKFAAKAVPWLVRALPITLISLIFSFAYAPSLAWAIPVALFIAGLASFQNTFAGLNGLEIGSGTIIGAAVAYILRDSALFPLSLALFACTAALLLWNRYPARVFPGDAGTLLIGSGIAGLLVLNGDIRIMVAGLLLFVPHVADLCLKFATNPKDMSQSKERPYLLLADRRLAIPRDASGKSRYDFAKLILRIFGPMKEWQVVAIMWAVVAANSLAVLLAFGLL